MVETGSARTPLARPGERPLRVAFLAQENLPVPPPVPGGSVARVVYELARRLPAFALDVTVCSLPHPSLEEGVHEGVRYLRVGAGRDPRRHAAYAHLLRLLRRLDLPHRELQGLPFYARDYARNGLLRLADHHPDIVHLQNVSQFLPLARRLVPGARIVLHMHCDWLRQLPPRTARRWLRHADLVVAVSDYIAGRIRDGFPDLPLPVRTLHNGADTDLFRPQPERRQELRHRWGVGEGPLLLYVGTIAPEKGVDVLVSAFARLCRRLPSPRLVIVGAPARYFQVRAPKGRKARAALRRRQRGYAAEVRRLAAPLGDRVVFAGPRSHAELPDWYGAADLLVMPSTGEEPFPLPVLEAMACGLAVVATRRGGLPEVVRDGESGRLVPAHDAAAMADALEELCRRSRLRAALGRRGRELVRERFTWEAQARRLAGYYRQLVGVPSASRTG